MKYISIVLWICIPMVALQAQKQFSVEEAISYGVTHHVKVKNAELDIRSAEKKVREVLGIGLPHLSAEGQFQHFIKIPTTVVPAKFFNPNAPDDALAELKFGTKYKLNGGATLSQLLFNGSYLVGLEASKAFANTTRIMKEKTIQDIRHDIGRAYYTVLMISENIKVVKEQIDLTEKLRKETMVLIEEGIIEKSSVRQLDLSLLRLQDALTAMEGQRRAAKAVLKFNMGYPIKEKILLTNDLEQKALQVRTLLPEDNPSFSKTPDMRLLANQEMLQALNIKNAKAEYWPVLAVFLNYSNSAQRNSFDFFDKNGKWFPTALWGLNLSIPIYSGGMTKAKISQARIGRTKVQNSKMLLDQSLQLRWTTALEGFHSAVTSFDRKVEAVKIAEELYDSAKIKFKEGIMSSIELDQTSTQRIKAEGDLMMARYKLVEARMELDYLLDR